MSKLVVGYYGNWSVYRSDIGKCDIEDLPVNLLTHVIYSFVGITTDGNIEILDRYNAIDRGGYQRFVNLKKKNPRLKAMVAIGGWDEGSEKYSAVMNNERKRTAFVKNAVQFVQKFGFDGLDLDWEYPAQRGGASSDKRAFTLLIKELRAEFDKRGLLLSAAVGVSPSLAQSSYDIPALNKYLHFINLMTYDIHSSADGRTGFNAPLNEINEIVRYWITQGASASKLILGVPTYGRTFTLNVRNDSKLGALTTGPGCPGPYTKVPGMLGYYEICQAFSAGGWKHYWDNAANVPYSVKNDMWVSYDDVRSIEKKARFARERGLGGCMVWSLETDDIRKGYPLLQKIRQIL